MRKLFAVKMLLCLSFALPLAAAKDPIGYWRLAEIQQDTVPNLVDDYAALVLSGEAEVVEGIDGGQALNLGDAKTYLVARDAAKLVVTDSLTLDAWVKVDALSDAMQAIIDKRGERYRLQLSGKTIPFFGLKGKDGRADLTGEQQVGERWVRLTGVFERPHMRLYVDGELVAERQWDRDIDAGGPLYIGSKSGVADFFHGSIDSIVIYDYARLPQPGDHAELKKRYPGRTR